MASLLTCQLTNLTLRKTLIKQDLLQSLVRRSALGENLQTKHQILQTKHYKLQTTNYKLRTTN